MEGKNMLVLVDLAAGNLAAQDFREDVVAIVSHAALPELRRA
jgi:hypothetical protein